MVVIRKDGPNLLSKHKFTPTERYAVFTVHGEVCYLCRVPIDMASFQVDHVIPENLEDNPERLTEVLQQFGLDDNFDLNSFHNWMPACVQCNNRKRATVFEPVPIILEELQKAAEKAGRASQLDQETRSRQQIGRALTIIEAAQLNGNLKEFHLDRLLPLLEYHEAHREPEKVHTPVLIGPGLDILHQEGDRLTIRGPYGVGVGRLNPPAEGGFRCGVCGYSAWSGARCVVCGTMDDD